MKGLRFWIIGITISLLILPTTAFAREIKPDLPPPPDWPIVGTVLRWLGFERAPEPVVSFNLSYPEYRLKTADEARALWDDLAPNEGVRIIVSEDDANTQLSANLGELGVLDATQVSFSAGSMSARATVKRSALERRGLKLPFFLMGEQISGSIELALGASECRPTLTVRRVRVGAFSVPIRSWVQMEIDDQVQQAWLPQVCVERVFILPGELAVEGYRR